MIEITQNKEIKVNAYGLLNKRVVIKGDSGRRSK